MLQQYAATVCEKGEATASADADSSKLSILIRYQYQYRLFVFEEYCSNPKFFLFRYIFSTTMVVSILRLNKICFTN